MYSIYDLLPTAKVVEINKSTGLRIGHMLAQQPLKVADVAAGAADQVITQGTEKFLSNGFIGFQDVNGEVTVAEAAAGVSNPQPYLHFTEELMGGYSQFLKHYMTKFEDSATNEVYPRMIALYPGDIFTTDNFVGTDAEGLVTIDPATGQLDFDIATTANALGGVSKLIFRAEATTLPDGVTAAYAFEYIGRLEAAQS